MRVQSVFLSSRAGPWLLVLLRPFDASDSVPNRLRFMGRISAHADVFRAIADPTRRALLDRLRGGAAPVRALAGEFSQSRPAISKHLRVLRQAQLVREQRVGRERLYEMDPGPLQRVAGWIEGYRAFWIMNLSHLKAHTEKR
jgi:DNA-binding transcriptional ArsR family regulator